MPERPPAAPPAAAPGANFLAGVAGLVASQLGVTSAFVARGTDDPDYFLVVLTHAAGGPAGGPVTSVEPIPLRLGPATGLGPEPIVVEDAGRDDSHAANGLMTAFPDQQSFVVVPIDQNEAGVVGLLGAGHGEARGYSKRDLDLLARAARLIRFDDAGGTPASATGAQDPSRELVGVSPDSERMMAAVSRVLVTGEAETISVQLDRAANGESFEIRFEPRGAGDAVAVVRDEAAASAERQVLQTLMDLLPDQVYVKDTASRFTRVNRAVLDTFGLTGSTEILGRTDFDFFPEAIARDFYAQEQEMFATGVPIIDVVENQVQPNHVDHWRRTSKIPIRDRTGAVIGLVGSSSDITAALSHERALARLAALVEWSNDAIIGIDKDGNISSWNPAAERLFGYPEAEVVGHPYLLLVPPDERMILFDDLVRRARDDDYVGSLETRRRRQDGSVTEVEIKASLIRDESGEPAGVSVIMREIAERKAAEARLRELELRYRTFVEQMPGITYINAATGDAQVMPLVHLHQRMEEWLGYPISEWERDPRFSFQLMHPDDREGVRKHHDETTVSGAPYRAEYRMLAKDGRQIWVRDEAVLVRGDDGEPLYWLGFLFDITDLKRAEAEVTDALAGQLAANVELARVSEAKSEIVSMISHEFRTPLTSIQGYSELLIDETLTPEEIRGFAATINANARRLARMIQEVLNLDRLESGQVEPRRERVNLNEITDDVIDSLRSTTGRHTFVTHFDPELPLITGDSDLLAQVVTNLVANAIKYAPAGGAVTLSTERRPDAVQLTVSDEGLGIPDDALETIFSRYSRIQRPEQQHIEGTGLGLPIARQIVELHGGSIWAESRRDTGARLHVLLPYRDSHPS